MPARIDCRKKMRKIVCFRRKQITRRRHVEHHVCCVFSGTTICRETTPMREHAWESWHASNERRIKFKSALKSQCYFTSVSRREESRAKTRQNWSIKKERIRAIEDTNSQLDIRRDQHRKWVISGDISGGGDKIGRKRSLDELQTGLCWFNAITSSPIK